MKSTTAELAQAIPHVLPKYLVPFIAGHPGIGKSAVVHQIAKKYNLYVIDIRLSQCDPVDLLGLPRVTKDNRSDYASPAMFPLQGDPIPEGYAGWIIFFDEFNAANLSLQAASYKIALDRMIGLKHLHPKAYVVCAGNLMDSGAITQRLSTAMQSRLIHYHLQEDIKGWLKWAYSEGIDYRITSYLEHMPQKLMEFKSDHDDVTFPCPRTWEFTSRIVKNVDQIDDHMVSLAGTITERAAREFSTYANQCMALPAYKDIMANPGSINIDTEPSMLYAVSHMIAGYLDKTNADKLITYIRRLPAEFGVLIMQHACTKDISIMDIPAIESWNDDFATKIY